MVKRQGYDDRADEHLGEMRRGKGKSKQSMAARRREMEGLDKAWREAKYKAVKTMDKQQKVNPRGLKHPVKLAVVRRHAGVSHPMKHKGRTTGAQHNKHMAVRKYAWRGEDCKCGPKGSGCKCAGAGRAKKHRK